jgi:RNA 2',3'-cyclic 3'-phosphodiesterase
MRLFIAVEMGDETRRRIAESMEKLKGMGFRARFVEPDNLHITLKFLGDVKEEQVKRLCEDADNVVKKHSRFSFTLDGVGYFGKRNDIRVVWVGVKDGMEALQKLMKEMQESLNYVRKDEHEPVPHLTIARVRYARENAGLADELEKMRDVKFGDVRVKEVKIKSSVLTDRGPVYSDYKSLSLRED